jgi:hypothetical protein
MQEKEEEKEIPWKEEILIATTAEKLHLDGKVRGYTGSGEDLRL